MRTYGFMTYLIVAVSAIAYADEVPEVVHVGMVAPRIIGVTVRAGHAEYGDQVPYKHREGDTIEDPQHHRWVGRTDRIAISLLQQMIQTMPMA
jgi:hypothetical protein